MNVILLIMDTIGYNYTSLGGGPAQMPYLQEWADNNLHLTNYISPATYTCQSIATILTGLSVIHHCTAMPLIPVWNLPVSIKTILDMFWEAGYTCAVMGDISHVLLLSRAVPWTAKAVARTTHNLNPQFHTCELFPRSEHREDIEFIPEKIIYNLNQLPEPYIAILHVMTAHGPCGDPTHMNALDKEHKKATDKDAKLRLANGMRDIYLHRLEDVDRRVIAPIIDRCRDDLLVITSDHGVDINMWATGVGHVAWNTIDAIFYMSYPKPALYTYPVGGVDVLPTLCEMCGIPVNHRIDGISIVDVVDNNIPNDRFYHSWANNCQIIQRLSKRITFRDPRLPDRWLPVRSRNIEWDDMEVGYWEHVEKHVDPTRPMIDMSHPLNKHVNVHDECVAEFMEWYEEQLRTPLYDGVQHVFTRYGEDIPENRDAKYAPTTVQ